MVDYHIMDMSNLFRNENVYWKYFMYSYFYMPYPGNFTHPAQYGIIYYDCLYLGI